MSESAKKAIRYIAVRDCFHGGRFFAKGTVLEIPEGGETPASSAFEPYSESRTMSTKVYDPTSDIVKQMKIGKSIAGLN